MKESIFKAPKRPEKISDQIIAQIRDIILAGDLKPGDKLGSEKELIAQFGVSKGTLREALRVLEAMGLVEIRKGLAGGVFIAEVDMKTTIHSIINFLHFKAVSIKDITMLRFFVEPFIVRIAASNIAPEDIEKLKAMIGNEVGEPRNHHINKGEIKKGISFHRYLARLTHNPILILIMDFVDNLLTDMKSQLDLGQEFYDKVKSSHRRVLECLSRGDADGAEKEIILDLVSVGKAMAEMSGTPYFDPAILNLSPTVNGTTDDGALDPTLFNLTSHLSAILKDQDISAQPSNGIILKHVGSGDLYMIVMKDKKKTDKRKQDK